MSGQAGASEVRGIPDTVRGVCRGGGSWSGSLGEGQCEPDPVSSGDSGESKPTGDCVASHVTKALTTFRI